MKNAKRNRLGRMIEDGLPITREELTKANLRAILEKRIPPMQGMLNIYRLFDQPSADGKKLSTQDQIGACPACLLPMILLGQAKERGVPLCKGFTGDMEKDIMEAAKCAMGPLQDHYEDF